MEAVGSLPPPDECPHTLTCMQFQGPVAAGTHPGVQPLSCGPAPDAPADSRDGCMAATASCSGLIHREAGGVQEDLALKVELPAPRAQAPQASGWEEGGPAHSCLQPAGARGGPAPSATSGFGSATRALRVNIALPLTGGGALAVRHGAGDGQAAGYRPAGRSEPSVAVTHLVGLGAAGPAPCPLPRQRPAPAGPATAPPPPCWAGQIRACSSARSPCDWWINLGTALPAWGLSQAASECCLRNCCTPGCSVSPGDPDPALGTPECLRALPREWLPLASEGRFWA